MLHYAIGGALQVQHSDQEIVLSGMRPPSSLASLHVRSGLLLQRPVDEGSTATGLRAIHNDTASFVTTAAAVPLLLNPTGGAVVVGALPSTTPTATLTVQGDATSINAGEAMDALATAVFTASAVGGLGSTSTGVTAISNALTVSQQSTFAQQLRVNQLTAATAVTVNGSVTVTGPLTLTDPAAFLRNLSSSTVNVNGPLVLSALLTAQSLTAGSLTSAVFKSASFQQLRVLGTSGNIYSRSGSAGFSTMVNATPLPESILYRVTRVGSIATFAAAPGFTAATPDTQSTYCVTLPDRHFGAGTNTVHGPAAATIPTLNRDCVSSMGLASTHALCIYTRCAGVFTSQVVRLTISVAYVVHWSI
jgi:hypothetical protein